MNKQEAEAKIVVCVQKVDAIRADPALPEVEKKRLIDDVEAEIRQLKNITGPRRIVGTGFGPAPDVPVIEE